MAGRAAAKPTGDELGPGPDDPEFGLEGVEEAAERAAERVAEQWVEYVGTPPYGREFIGERVISRADAKAGWNDLDPGKDLVWNGENNYRIPVADLDLEVVEVLTKREAGFKLTDKRI